MASHKGSTCRQLAPGVEIRTATPADHDLLRRYFEGLPADDRYLRFLAPCADPRYLDAWLDLADDGGASYILCRTDADGEVTCIGEAGYAPRGDGTAEFALSVAAEVRGGLGSALIAHLCEAAAADGIRALHADVLTDNGAMNHLLRRWGGITVERATRLAGVVISTTAGVPPWPELEPAPSRVLIESSEGRWEGEELLREAGHQVAICPGPHGRPDSDPCPVLVGHSCELIEGADLVVHDLSPDSHMNRRLAAALERGAAQAPLVRRAAGADAVAVEAVMARWEARDGELQADADR